MISIRYKALLPMALLAVVLLALIATAAFSLSESMRLNRSLGARYHEVEEVRQIEVVVSKLIAPYISYLETGAAEHHDTTVRILDELDERVRELRSMAVVNAEEREVLEFVEQQLGEIRKHSHAYFQTEFSDHHVLMQSLYELSREHFRALGARLHDYHDDEIRQVDELVQQSQRLQEVFRLAALAAAGIAAALFLLAIWINNRILVRPILSISKSTAGIADGKLEQHVAVVSNDELGRLSQDINRMAQSLQTMYRRLDQLAHTDQLTGLMNRRAFERIADRELDAARRYGRNLGLVLVDIDHFKLINDTWGHAIGDEVLKFVAHTCAASLRASDTCFRIGGEEFVLLLQEAGDEQALAIAERLRRTLEDSPWVDADNTLSITASFGVACFPRDGDSRDTLLKQADAALYMAKHGGRNRVAGMCGHAERAVG
jgi:diguanylate cyclase (GGDEF)-like protein